jgi:uncharacterized membrane protein YfcA
VERYNEREPRLQSRDGTGDARQNIVKLFIFVGMNVGGAGGWWLGEHVGLLTALLASGAGSILGVYAGWRLARELLC